MQSADYSPMKSPQSKTKQKVFLRNKEQTGYLYAKEVIKKLIQRSEPYRTLESPREF